LARRISEVSVVIEAETGDYPVLLLVDDCVAERDLYALTLRRRFKILTAARGLDGLTLAIARKPDLIVLDVKMPGLDGWETCTRIKSHPVTADIPVILLTGCDDVDLSQHAVAVGASAVLNKPCPPERLNAQIAAALGLAV
jgi:cyclic di-GMP phosphodiesterase